MSRRASPSDTICAIATAVGEAAVAVLRLSGPDAIAIARRLAPALPAEPVHRRVYVARLLRNNELLDEAVLLVFCAPHSFTGEDVVEVQCHGGRLNTRRVLDAIVDAGARVAEAGEFTRRALLNGRLDLTQVEAIADVIHARSEASLRLAQRHLAGELRTRVERWRDTLLELVVLVEAAIDFSLEEHVFTVTAEQIVTAAAPLRDEMRLLLAGFDAGRLRYDGVRVALVGRPNAGKSSLLNALLGTQRAIVTDIPGTTRDSIEESIELGGLLFRLADTAGLRDAADVIEQLGIARSRALAADADLVVYVVDATSPTDLDELRTELGGQDGLVVWNKTDLEHAAPAPQAPNMVSCCLLRGEGLDALRAALVAWAVARSGDLGDELVLIGRARHRDAIAAAAQALERAVDAAASGLPHELVALDLRAALDAIGELTGAITSDDILNRIFAGFCIGK